MPPAAPRLPDSARPPQPNSGQSFFCAYNMEGILLSLYGCTMGIFLFVFLWVLLGPSDGVVGPPDVWDILMRDLDGIV